jgi:glycosyltransferase involved in cell wall biosynthesis
MRDQHTDTSPRLSVIVPTHNVDVYVEECILSILRQNVDGMEVIVVDDHSSDGTLSILRRFEDADSRVTVIEALGFGGGNARNVGARLARGRFIVFADGDDILPDDAYCAMVNALENSGSDLVVGRFLKFSATRTWDPTKNSSERSI